VSLLHVREPRATRQLRGSLEEWRGNDFAGSMEDVAPLAVGVNARVQSRDGRGRYFAVWRRQRSGGDSMGAAA
jgi:hypothetical protein